MIEELYIQKVRQIIVLICKKNIVSANSLRNKNCRHRNSCTWNYVEKNIFKKFWGLTGFNKQNGLVYEAVELNIVIQRSPANGKMSPRNCSLRHLLN